MIEFNLPTLELCKKAASFIEALGFTQVTSGERWEGDGVFIVSGPPATPDRHWYLYVSGNDSEDYPAGIDLVLINGGETSDDVVTLVTLETLHDLPALLRKNGYLA